MTSSNRFGLTSSVAVVTLAMAAESRAQLPDPLPPLPSDVVSAPAETPVVVSGGCTPAHCSHKTAWGRKRCKRHLQEVFLGFPDEFERPPLGAFLYAANRTQVRNAEAAAMTFYQFDFEADGSRLNRRGVEKLNRFTAKLPITFHPIIVERSDLASLDQKRRLGVLAALNTGPFPIPPERVVIGPAISRGLDGGDAEVIAAGALDRVARSGPTIGSGTAPSSGAATR